MAQRRDDHRVVGSLRRAVRGEQESEKTGPAFHVRTIV
jgi:hypothetical protein